MYYIVKNKEEIITHGWGIDVASPHEIIRYDNYSDYLAACETFNIEEPTEEVIAVEVLDISPAQGKTQLDRIGKYDEVIGMIEASGSRELKIFWEYATTWLITSDTIKAFAYQLGWSDKDLKDFFEEASKINV